MAAASSLVLAALTAPVFAQEVMQDAVDEQYVWDLTPFYATYADWEAELERLQGEIDGLAAFEGRLGDNAETLLAALDAQRRVLRAR